MKSIIPKYSNKPLKKKEAIQVDLSDFEIPCINFDLSTYKSKIYTLESKEDGKKYLLKKPIQNKNESHEKYKSRSYNIALKEYLFANYYNAMIEQDNIPAAPKTYIATKDDVL